jgi:hypothetical protein
MVGWKKTVSQAAAFGAAFALLLCMVGGAWIWYANSPHPTAWNNAAIRATFKDLTMSTSQQPPKEYFSYILENTTDADYSLDPSTVLVMATLPDGKGLDQDHSFTLSSSDIPAKQKVVVSISRDFDYQGDPNDLDKLSEVTNRHLKEIDGFVLFDKVHRYKIILPNGWPDVKKK